MGLSWLCWFLPHKWEIVFDISQETDGGEKIRKRFGLYQCKRCKLISKGMQLEKLEKMEEKHT